MEGLGQSRVNRRRLWIEVIGVNKEWNGNLSIYPRWVTGCCFLGKSSHNSLFLVSFKPPHILKNAPEMYFYSFKNLSRTRYFFFFRLKKGWEFQILEGLAENCSIENWRVKSNVLLSKKYDFASLWALCTVFHAKMYISMYYAFYNVYPIARLCRFFAISFYWFFGLNCCHLLSLNFLTFFVLFWIFLLFFPSLFFFFCFFSLDFFSFVFYL